jgi:hypothetical protein
MDQVVEIPKYQVSKSTSETYHITVPGSCLWANITINPIGDLNIQSDYGDFNYGWRSFGKDFKEFLLRIFEKANQDGSYLYDKLHDSNKASMVDVKRTIAAWKEEVINRRRESGINGDGCTREEAREAYDALSAFQREAGSTCTQDYFFMWMDRPEIDAVLDFEWRIYEGVRTTGDIRCRAFCIEIAPIFAEILREELSQKENAAN